MKSSDKKVMSILTAVAVISGSALAGGITGAHSAEATKEYLCAKNDEEVKAAEQNRRFWNAMHISADVVAVCGGYAAGLLVKDAFGLGKK